MATLKCKMCGGDLEIQEGLTVCECEYCGSKQTLPRLDSDRKANLYDRANHFRRNNEFDKAMGIYENILNEDSSDAEAYWSIVLCRYGIEYVEDPDTHKRVPTVNRAQYTSIFDDEDYKSATKNAADTLQRQVYEAEANTINNIQKGILEISQKEEPFDVFISFKETGVDGRRTRDAVLAHELYNELSKEGFKVFFAPVTLENKLGEAYEPYIFAALNSAKVMVVLGTKPEHFNAVWVKNEWSRYLALIKQGAKKTLIPAYKDMDPYDLPEEFKHLMAQDMSRLGFMQDLTRGIKKLTEIGESKKEIVRETVVVQSESGVNYSALLKRGNMALEDGDFAKADSFFEQVLNINAECGEAYLGKFLIEVGCKSITEYVNKMLSMTEAEDTIELVACPAEYETVERASSDFEIKGYYSKAEIIKQFEFERMYKSSLASRQKQLADEKSFLGSNKTFLRAKQYSDVKTCQLINDMENRILFNMQKRVDSSKSDDEQSVERITQEYSNFVSATLEKVKEISTVAAEKKVKDEKAAEEKMIADKKERWLRFLLPGIRNSSIFVRVFSIIVYSLIVILSIIGCQSTIPTIFLILCLTSFPAVWGNYLGILDLLKITKIKSKVLKIVLSFIISVILAFIFATLAAIFSEY